MSDVDKALAEANRLAQAGDLGGAFNAFQRIVQTDPENLVALMMMGEILVTSRQFDDAITVFGRAVEAAPGELTPRANLVRLLHMRGRHMEILEHVDILIDKDPTNPHWYSIPAYIYHALGELEKVRHYVDTGLEKALRGVDFLPGKRHPIPDDIGQRLAESLAADAEAAARDLAALYAGPAAVTWAPEPGADGGVRLSGAGVGLGADAAGDGAATYWAADTGPLDAAKETRVRFCAGKGGDSAAGDWAAVPVPVIAPTEADTGAATVIAETGATLNGAVGGSTLPGRYHFEYGTGADALDEQTPERPLPAGPAPRVHDLTAPTIGRWHMYSTEFELAETDRPDGGPDGGTAFVARLVSPFGKDRNHLSGIGAADLLGGWDSALHAREKIDRRYPGDSLDLRDAEVEFTVRGTGFEPEDFHFSFWINGYKGTTSTDIGEEDAAPWSLSGQLIDGRVLTDGRWHTFRFTLTAASTEWTFAGNNVPEQEQRGERYAYQPLHDILADHRGNLVLILLLGDERKTPRGTVEFHSARLLCRNTSILGPGFPARPVAWPKGSLGDPALLTAGAVGDPACYWYTGPDPAGPQELVWDLGQTVAVTALRVRQNPLKPAKDVEVLASKDGQAFGSVSRFTLPAPDAAKGGPLHRYLALDDPAAFRFLKLVLHSGYGDDFWGLDGVEAYGAGIDPAPVAAPVHVCEDVTGLEPGSTVHYRLVAENAEGRHAGPVRTHEVPADARPVIFEVRPFRIEKDRTTLLVRLSAMGAETRLSGRFEGAGATVEPASANAGYERTPRHMIYVIEGLEPATAYEGTLSAENATGTSEPFAIAWETAP